MPNEINCCTLIHNYSKFSNLVLEPSPPLPPPLIPSNLSTSSPPRVNDAKRLSLSARKAVNLANLVVGRGQRALPVVYRASRLFSPALPPHMQTTLAGETWLNRKEKE